MFCQTLYLYLIKYVLILCNSAHFDYCDFACMVHLKLDKNGFHLSCSNKMLPLNDLCYLHDNMANYHVGCTLLHLLITFAQHT